MAVCGQSAMNGQGVAPPPPMCVYVMGVGVDVDKGHGKGVVGNDEKVKKASRMEARVIHWKKASEGLLIRWSCEFSSTPPS